MAAPTFSPPAGSFTSTQSVTIGSTTPGAAIRYALDGTPPDGTSPLYTVPLSITGTTTLSARAFKTDWVSSAVTSGTYIVSSSSAAAPIITPRGGRVATGTSVHVTSAEPGVTLRYTLDGREPGETDPAVGAGTVTIGKSEPLKVKAFKPGLAPSSTSTETYEVTGAIAIGGHHVVVLKFDGTLAGWGMNGNGQLADGSTVDRYRPVTVASGIDSVIAVAAGATHTLALRSDSTVWAWGDNGDGALGNGTSGNRNTPPGQVLQSAGVPLTGVVAIAAGFAHSVALKSNGTVWTWGDNYWGELGNGGRSRLVYATQVPGLNGVSAISASGWYNLALQTNGASAGNVWAWGINDSGQQGDGTTTSSAPTAHTSCSKR